MSGLIWDNITFTYTEGGKNVLEDVSLEIPARQVTLITGPSGCGKSTLLYLAAGLYPQNAGFLTSGRILLDGMDIADIPPEQRARRIGMLFQNPDLQFCMDTVFNELVFCLENVGTPPNEIDARILYALDFCEAQHLKSRKLITLSGGEKQRISLACIVALQPQWLLLDEPFANIDASSARFLTAKLMQLHIKKDIGIVVVDHHLDMWQDNADEVIFFQHGGTISARAKPPISALKLMQHGVAAPSKPYQSVKPEKSPNELEIVLRLRDVSVSCGGTKVLEQIDADFYRGRIHAIVGESGCGKSTLFRMLCKLHPYEGQVQIHNRELKKIRRKNIGQQIGFVFQSPQDQFVTGSVYDEIAVGLKKRLTQAELNWEVERILRDTGLWKYHRLSPYMLSQGQQRRLGVAALLAYDCHILVCDEPTYAQDWGAILALMSSLQRQVIERRLMLIFSTHDLKLAKNFADFIYCLEGGQLHAIDQSSL